MSAPRSQSRWLPSVVASAIALVPAAFFGLFFFWPIGSVLRQAFIDAVVASSKANAAGTPIVG